MSYEISPRERQDERDWFEREHGTAEMAAEDERAESYRRVEGGDGDA